MSNTTRNTLTLPVARFELGDLYMTPMIKELLTQRELFSLIARHAKGDWGMCCEEDRQANEAALQHGARLLSAYKSESGEKVWIITEADRSATTVLLPSEY